MATIIARKQSNGAGPATVANDRTWIGASVHVSTSDNLQHELSLLCDDMDEFLSDTRNHGVACTAVQDEGWGLLTQVTLPGGGKLGVYQPRHARPATKRAE